MIHPNDLNELKFEKSAVFGYRIDDVNAFVAEVQRTLTKLYNENEDLENKMAILAAKLEEYRQEEDSLGSALLGAQKLGNSIVREAKGKAELIISDAKSQSDRMIESARKKLEAEEQSLKALQTEVANFKSRLLSLYRTHLNIINALPNFDEPEEPPQEEQAPFASQPQPEYEEREERKVGFNIDVSSLD